LSVKYGFDRVIDRRGTGSVKWDGCRRADTIAMWIADMDFQPPPAVRQALRRRVDEAVFGYTMPTAELVETVLAMLRRRHGWDVPAEAIVWLPDLTAGLHLACWSTAGAGEEVLTTVPIYPPFLKIPGHCNRRVVTVPMVSDGRRYVLDMGLLGKVITPRTRLLLWCSPHNPTGRVFSRAELAAVADVCTRHGLTICSDEIHCGLVLDEDKPHISMATLSPEVAARTITLLSPSKTYNIPGLRCSMAIIPDAGLRATFLRSARWLPESINALGYTACQAAYEHGDEWLAALREYLRGNRAMVEQAVAAMPGISMHRSEATYLAWLDCRAAGLGHPTRFFDEAGVSLSDGEEFGAPGFCRLNFGCPRSVLAEALDRMAAAVDTHRAKAVARGA